MGEVFVGTCSWTDPTLIESKGFYPDWVKTPEERLQYYSSHFSLVEIDSTYYALPSQKTSGLWVERTKRGFIFDLKAFRIFTLHPTPPQAFPSDIRKELPGFSEEKRAYYLKDLPREIEDELWRRFENSILPLDSSGKLGVVLFQFPPWFNPGVDSLNHILKCQEKLPQFRIAIEFRNNLWLNERNREKALAFLKRNNLSYVCVDEPQGFKSSIPPIVEATTDIGIIRFHGRNRETWEKKGLTAAERFNYLYSEKELEEWVPKIRALQEKTKQVHILFNNCFRDRAVVNAWQIRALLPEEKTEKSDSLFPGPSPEQESKR